MSILSILQSRYSVITINGSDFLYFGRDSMPLSAYDFIELSLVSSLVI